jgi:autotransporter-associated beta strand protein
MDQAMLEKRTRVKIFRPLLIGGVGLIFGVSISRAATAASVDFSSGYTTGNLVGQNGWATYGTNTAGPIQVSPGGAALAGTNTPQSAFKQYTPYQFAEAGGRVFIRFDMNVTSASTLAPTTNTSGGADFFMVTHEMDNSGTTTQGQPSGKSYFRIYIKSSGTGFVLGWNPHSETASTTMAEYGPTEYAFNQTNTILIRCDSTTGRQNDKSYLYVNPLYTTDPTTLTPVLSRTSWTGNNADEFSYNAPSATNRLSGYLNLVLKQQSGNALTVSKLMVGDAMTDVGYVAPASGTLNYTNNATTGTSTWTTSADWSPSVPSSATNSALILNGVLTSALEVSNNTTGNFKLNSLTFANTGSGNLNLTGNPLQFVNSGGTNPVLAFSTTAAVIQSVGNNLQIDADLTLRQASQTASNSTVAGMISGSGGLSKSGTGYAYITGVNNSFSGPVTVSAGVLGAATLGMSGQASSLGTNGTIYLGDSAGLASQLRSTQSADQTSDKTILLAGSGAYHFIENYGTTGTVLTLSGNVGTSTNGVKSLRLNPKNGPIVVSGTIGANMADNQLSLMLTNGLNQLTLTRSNAYNGGTYLQGGTLALSNSYALGTGVVNLYAATITALTNINLMNNFQFAAAGVTAQITATTKVDMTNKVSGNIAGYLGVDGVVRINTAFATAYLANPTNTFNSVLITQGAIAADSLGVAGSPSPLGTSGTITFGNGGVSILKYLGSGETNAKTLAFAPGTSQWSILEHRGTGLLKLTTPLQIDRTTANTLILESQPAGSGELAGSIANAAGLDIAVNGTRLAKSGTGDWILSASNDYRNTSIQEGRLIARDSNALPATRDVEMAGGTLLVNYSGAGATLGNLCLTNFKSSPNRYINTAVVPETYKFNDSTIDLGTNRNTTLVFSSATNWISNQATNAAIIETYGRNQYLKVTNSSIGGSLYITDTNAVPLSRIVCAENTNITAKITSAGLIYFNLPNTTPVITSSQGFAVNENVSSGTVVGTVVGSDAENNTLSNWMIESGNTGNPFAINSSNGQITVVGALNYEGTRTYSLGVTVSDGIVRSAVQTVTVTVLNVAEYSDFFGSSIPTADDNGDGISNLMAYALGATSPSSVIVLPALNNTDSTKLKITALIRINDPKLNVVGEYGTTLGTWETASPITGTDSSDQTGALAGVTKKKDFSVSRGTDSKKFLHLKATQTQ